MPSDGRWRAGERRRYRPACDDLEGRTLLSATNTDFLLSGFRWQDPSHITYSIAPDGVAWDAGMNNLNATFDARFGPGVWERELARALATWEAVANINIVPTVETGANPFNMAGLVQGDPRFGDIRFAGYAFQNAGVLAQSYYPPPQGLTAAGDSDINTSMNWSLNGNGYDLYSVMLHETGLTLGLAEPPAGGNVVMDTIYGGVRSGLTPSDIAGAQALYGPRTLDANQGAGQGLQPGNAIDLTARLGSAGPLTVGNLSLATVGDTEYFSVVAPAGGSAAGLRITAGAAGVSMLSPKVSVFDGSGQLVDVAGDPSAWSNDVTVHVGRLVPGTRYLIAVTGATTDAFAVGAYQLQLTLTSPTPTPTPAIPPPPTISLPVTTEPTVATHSVNSARSLKRHALLGRAHRLMRVHQATPRRVGPGTKHR